MIFAEEGISATGWTWISIAVGAACTLLGALAKTINDVIRARTEAKVTLAKAEAEAKVTLAKAKREDDEQAVGQWRDLYRTTREELGRLVAHVDEMSKEMGEIREDHRECQEDNGRLFAAYDGAYDALSSCAKALREVGKDVSVPPRMQRPPPRPSDRAEREFKRRELEQNTTLLSKQGKEVLRLPDPPAGGG
jgi:uncharacterized protein (UPF0216 family)